MIFTKYPYLQDSQFLQDLTLRKNKTLLCRVILLDLEEEPIANIEGRVQDGTLQVDGSSSIRRQGNISFVLGFYEKDKIDIKQMIKTGNKIALEIGYVNNYKQDYPQYANYSTIWFPQGVFIIANPSFSKSLEDYQISFDLRDKMCQLNGILGGTFPATITLGEYDVVDENGAIVTKPISMYQLVQELVNHWGGEQLGKIIINDLPKYTTTPMMWNGSAPLYLFYNSVYDKYRYSLSNTIRTNETFVQAFDKGEYAGRGYTVFSYPEQASEGQGIFTVSAGTTVESALHQIKEKLGNFEFFYDIDGNFVFQEVRNYMNTNQATVTLNLAKQLNLDMKDYLVDLSMGNSKYQFVNYPAIISISENEQWDDLKNDFVLWGKKKVTDDIEVSVRYHLAIDEKPTYTDPNGYDCLIGFKRDSAEKVSVLIDNRSAEILTSCRKNCEDETIIDAIEELETTVEKLESGYGYAEYFRSTLVEGKTTPEEKRTERQKFIKNLKIWANKVTGGEDKEIDWSTLDYLGNKHIILGKQLSDLIDSYIAYENYLYETENQGSTNIDEPSHDIVTGFELLIYKKCKNTQEFPAVGDEEFIYVDESTNKFYKWVFNSSLKCYNYEEIDNDEDLRFYTITTTYPQSYKDKYEIREDIDWRVELWLSGYNDDLSGVNPNYYYAELMAELPKYLDFEDAEDGKSVRFTWKQDYLKSAWQVQNNKVIRTDKSEVDTLAFNYYIDFIDGGKDLQQYNIQNIGRRLDSTVDEDNVNCVFEPDIPEVVILNPTLLPKPTELNSIIESLEEIYMPYTFAAESEVSDDGWDYLTDTSFWSDLASETAYVYNSAFYEIRNHLYEKTAIQKNVSLETLPIYYLEPNSRVTIKDDICEIDGDFMITNFSLPLSQDGTTSIELSSVLETI